MHLLALASTAVHIALWGLFGQLSRSFVQFVSINLHFTPWKDTGAVYKPNDSCLQLSNRPRARTHPWRNASSYASLPSHFHCLFSSVGTLHDLESSAMFSEWHWWAVLGFVGSEAVRSVGVLSPRGLQVLTLFFSPLLPGSWGERFPLF